jgi:hypothetical protein
MNSGGHNAESKERTAQFGLKKIKPPLKRGKLNTGFFTTDA